MPCILFFLLLLLQLELASLTSLQHLLQARDRIEVFYCPRRSTVTKPALKRCQALIVVKKGLSESVFGVFFWGGIVKSKSGFIFCTERKNQHISYILEQLLLTWENIIWNLHKNLVLHQKTDQHYSPLWQLTLFSSSKRHSDTVLSSQWIALLEIPFCKTQHYIKTADGFSLYSCIK